MTKDLKLPHDGMVLVSDGRKALFLKNQGDDVYPNYQVERVLEAIENPQMREQSNGHDQAERQFANDVADAINVVASRAEVKSIVVAAAPRTLAQLRTHLSDAVKQKILAEVNKDLTKHPVFEIEQHLTGRA